MPKAQLNLAAKFAGSSNSQKSHYETRIKELEAEVEALRSASVQTYESDRALQGKLGELAQELAEVGGVQKIALHLIDRNPDQPRKTFPQHDLLAFAEILKNEGQQMPVILIPQEEGRYMLFDGERRWRSAPLAGWKTIEAVIKPEGIGTDKDQLRRQALSTTIHRQDLHPLDLAECLIDEIVYQHPKLEANAEEALAIEIPRILNTVITRLEKSQKIRDVVKVQSEPRESQRELLSSIDLKPQEFMILEVLLGLQFNPSSINANIFPMLKLPDDVKQIIRQEGLEASKANELKKLESSKLEIGEQDAAKLRTKIGKQIVAEQLSLSAVRQLIKETLCQYKSTSKDQVISVGERAGKVISSISRFNPVKESKTDLEVLRDTLRAKLLEIEEALKMHG
jgi:ParB family transcriptional regulator, chromosome partitioning protein